MTDLDIEHLCLATGAKRVNEFEGIFSVPDGGRPVMSPPPNPAATKRFIDEIRHELDLSADVAERVADWAAQKMERYSAIDARPVFEMDGSGPCCSVCGCIWPLCGHHHWSHWEGESESEVKEA